MRSRPFCKKALNKTDRLSKVASYFHRFQHLFVDAVRQ